VWLGVAAETKEVGWCGRITVEADDQSSRRPAARLEECTQAYVDEPGVEETEAQRRGDRHSRPVGETGCTDDGPGSGDRTCRQVAAAACGWQRHHVGGGGWVVNGSGERGSAVAMAMAEIYVLVGGHGQIGFC
jgi:hypothetical protein